MSLYNIKIQFQDVLRPLSDHLAQQGITANQITISAVIVSGTTAYIIAVPARQNMHLWYTLPIGLFIRMALNAIDGMIATEHLQASTLGAVLNEAGDLVSDTLLLASLAPYLNNGTDQQLIDCNKTVSNKKILNQIIALSIYTEVVAIMSTLTTGLRANQGPLGKSDRAFVLGLVGIAVGSGIKAVIPAKHFMYVNQTLLLITLIKRVQFILVQRWQTRYDRQLQRLIAQPPHQLLIKTAIEKSNIMSQKILNTPIIHEQSCFNTYDGTALFYRYWVTKPLAKILAANNSNKTDSTKNDANKTSEKIVILLHRGHEHSGRLDELATAFVSDGYQVFAWDARGNGRSGGKRDHADSFSQLVRDLDSFVRVVMKETGANHNQILIVASSIGAIIAAAWVHDYAPKIRGMILGTPAIAIRLYMPMAIPALKTARKLGIMGRVSSYVKAKFLTHDNAAQASYNADPLISNSISTDLLIDTHATGQRLLDDAASIITPTFILCAGEDYVVDKLAERDFYEKLSSPFKRWKLYPDSFHAIFHELNKNEVFADCLSFANELFSRPLNELDLTHADQDSASKNKVDRLAVKPDTVNFILTRLAMQKFGHVSDAIATGLEYGFDSGKSLDKVYRNLPHGKKPLGKIIDAAYLNNIGWQGIRIRRQHLIELATLAIKELEQSNTIAINLLDIASGNGFYAFELLNQYAQLNAELRDYDVTNITVLNQTIEDQALSNRVVAVQKDAFMAENYHLPKAQDKFNLAISSGIFELFSDNSLVNTAITGVYDSLIAGGYYLYTNQPWHPEQEFIGKTLTNHKGENWTMRCRSQVEMDQLVESAGFKKIDTRIDQFGIFSVSLAQKPNSPT